MADTERPKWPMTPMSTGDPEAADPPRPSPVPREDPPADSADPERERMPDEREADG